jgi:hypothetical protein
VRGKPVVVPVKGTFGATQVVPVPH